MYQSLCKLSNILHQFFWLVLRVMNSIIQSRSLFRRKFLAFYKSKVSWVHRQNPANGLHHMLSHFNPNYIFNSCFSDIHFNTTLLWDFPTKMFVKLIIKHSVCIPQVTRRITGKTADLHPQRPRKFSPVACGSGGPWFGPVCSEHQRTMHQTYWDCTVYLSVQGSQDDLRKQYLSQNTDLTLCHAT